MKDKSKGIITNGDKRTIAKMQKHISAVVADVQHLYTEHERLTLGVAALAGALGIAGLAVLISGKVCKGIQRSRSTDAQKLCTVVATWQVNDTEYVIALEDGTRQGNTGAILCAVTADTYTQYGGDAIIGETVWYDEQRRSLTFFRSDE